ncbi:hypothetical protein [Coprococcus comes]|uniref:hypothetical protein n=1 Tax=Coprococcus comes TaxID=410072 RepID=UPI00189D0833|nr:hypothetical protein [Coprococcus comes]
MKIVSGRTGSPHVTSQQFRQMLEGIIGQGSYIITSGENLKPELSSNNLMKIRSGMMAHHGCISCVDIGTYDEVTLTNGSQGMKRIDLIVNRYTRNAETEVENCSWKVIQGTPVASNPAVPAYTSGNLQNGDLVDDCPAFEVHYDGINVTEVKSLLSVADGLSELSSNLESISADSGWQYMTASNLSEKLKFRKVGHTVYVAGSLRFSDNGKFANDQALGSVPSGMTPNGYDDFESLIPIAMHNGGPAGTQARIYIKNGVVYIVGTDSASFVMVAATAYFS